MFLLVVLFIAIPIAELYVIIKVGEAIGVLPTIALLILDSIVGVALLRHQGRAAWVRFNRALAENRVPAREVFDGVLVIFGGALLITPGFLTDIVGLLLLIPPSRAATRGIATRVFRSRLNRGARVATWGWGRRPRRAPGPEPGWPPRGGRPTGPEPGDIEGTAHEIRDGDSLGPGESKPGFDWEEPPERPPGTEGGSGR